MSEIRRGYIFYVSPYGAVTTGSEQQPGRPAVVVSGDKQNESSPVVEMCYMTTAPKHDLPTHVETDATGRRSTILCEQIMSVNVSRLGEHIGQLPPEDMREVDAALAVSVGLEPPCCPEGCRGNTADEDDAPEQDGGSDEASLTDESIVIITDARDYCVKVARALMDDRGRQCYHDWFDLAERSVNMARWLDAMLRQDKTDP